MYLPYSKPCHREGALCLLGMILSRLEKNLGSDSYCVES